MCLVRSVRCDSDLGDWPNGLGSGLASGLLGSPSAGHSDWGRNKVNSRETRFVTLISSRALARSAGVLVNVWVVVTLPLLRRLRRRELETLEELDEDELLELEPPSDEERPHRAIAASTIAARVPRLRPRPPDDTDDNKD
jgi:hypothetical protein